MHVLDYYFSKKNNYAFSNKNYKLEKLVIKKTLFYDDISTSTLRAMRAQTQKILPMMMRKIRLMITVTNMMIAVLMLMTILMMNLTKKLNNQI